MGLVKTIELGIWATRLHVTGFYLVLSSIICLNLVSLETKCISTHTVVTCQTKIKATIRSHKIFFRLYCKPKHFTLTKVLLSSNYRHCFWSQCMLCRCPWCKITDLWSFVTKWLFVSLFKMPLRKLNAKQRSVAKYAQNCQKLFQFHPMNAELSSKTCLTINWVTLEKSDFLSIWSTFCDTSYHIATRNS